MRFKRVKMKEFTKHFNINKTNRVVGFTPDFVGSSKSKTVKAKNFLLEFISCNFNTISDSVSDSCKNDLYDSINSPRIVYSAGFDTCTSHLKEYFKDNTTEKFISRDYIIKIISYSNFKWFVAPKCSFERGIEIFDYIRINPKSYPGHYSEKIFGRTKDLGDSLSRNVAYKLWQKICKKTP